MKVILKSYLKNDFQKQNYLPNSITLPCVVLFIILITKLFRCPDLCIPFCILADIYQCEYLPMPVDKRLISAKLELELNLY